ncbi:hypothetical protein A8W25_27940 [Streptomyces sp. ERV7]|nr:hypothetical protein A8W25_27940 [Streptomyces sp. ERV7]
MGGVGVAAQLVDVGEPAEDGDAWPAFVCGARRRQRLVVAAEFDQGVDAQCEGQFVVTVDGECGVGRGERAGEVVAGGGQRRAPRECGVVVGGPQLERVLKGLIGLRVAGGVAVGPRLLDVGGAQPGPRGGVFGLRLEVGLQGGDAARQIGRVEAARRGGGHGGSTRRVLAVEGERPEAEPRGERQGDGAATQDLPAPPGRGRGLGAGHGGSFQEA